MGTFFFFVVAALLAFFFLKGDHRVNHESAGPDTAECVSSRACGGRSTSCEVLALIFAIDGFLIRRQSPVDMSTVSTAADGLFLKKLLYTAFRGRQ